MAKGEQDRLRESAGGLAQLCLTLNPLIRANFDAQRFCQTA